MPPVTTSNSLPHWRVLGSRDLAHRAHPAKWTQRGALWSLLYYVHGLHNHTFFKSLVKSMRFREDRGLATISRILGKGGIESTKHAYSKYIERCMTTMAITFNPTMLSYKAKTCSCITLCNLLQTVGKYHSCLLSLWQLVVYFIWCCENSCSKPLTFSLTSGLQNLTCLFLMSSRSRYLRTWWYMSAWETSPQGVAGPRIRRYTNSRIMTAGNVENSDSGITCSLTSRESEGGA